MGKCCGGNADALLAAKLGYGQTPEASGLSIRRTAIGKGSTPRMDNPDGSSIRMQFVGTRQGASTFHGARGSGRQYRGGNNAVNRYANVHPEDVAVLEASSMWRRVGVQLGETAAVMAPVISVTGPATDVQVANVTTGEAVAVAELATVDTVVEGKPIVTAEGVVKRKRVVRAAKNTPLKDLPEK